MSFYNMVHGMNSQILIMLINLTKIKWHEFPRFRDIFIIIKGEIIVYHRVGSPNRENYTRKLAKWEGMKNFIRWEDDTEDPTYARHYFKLTPHKWVKLKKQIDDYNKQKPKGWVAFCKWLDIDLAFFKKYNLEGEFPETIKKLKEL